MRRALVALATYYLATGAWPILDMRSFEAVTGPKSDHWLVKTVGALAVANGAVLAFGARREDVREETLALAAATALTFSAIDIIYVLQRRIRPIFLADTVVEFVLLAAILGGA